MKIYISGKISDLREDVFIPRFEKVEIAFRMLKYTVINPTTLPAQHDKSWKSYMRVDLNALKHCDAIFMMNCWQDSRGARIEEWFAKRYNKLVIYQPKD